MSYENTLGRIHSPIRLTHGHLGLHAIGLELEGQVKHTSRVAAIHYERDKNSSLETTNEILVQIVVANLASTLIIQWDKSLIISVLLQNRK